MLVTKTLTISRILTVMGTTLSFQANALDNGLAKTPPMGWNSWNCFAQNINETQIKEIADVMVSSGMKDAGYVYLNLDDNWMATSRDANGNLRPDPSRFPGGMKALGDYIHSKGLKFGIYGDRGTETCYFRDNFKELDTKSGSIGREVQDARTFASWGVDYLKYDNCLANSATMQKDYEAMRDALATCGRDIVYSICAWEFQPWMPSTGNLWRTTTDILNIWKKSNQWSWGIVDIVDLNEPRAPHAKPGAWNDPDMLQVGNYRSGSPTDIEYRAHMTLWCVMAAPLIAGNDIRKMNQATKDILLNKEVIAVDQDSAGIQGTRVTANNGLEVWCKPLGSKNGNSKAIALFNRNASASNISVKFSDIGLSGTVVVRDLWTKEDKGEFKESFSVPVPSHGAELLKITKKDIVAVSSAKSQVAVGGERFKTEMRSGRIAITPLIPDANYSVRVFTTDGKLLTVRENVAPCTLPIFGNGVFVVCIGKSGSTGRAVLLHY